MEYHRKLHKWFPINSSEHKIENTVEVPLILEPEFEPEILPQTKALVEKLIDKVEEIIKEEDDGSIHAFHCKYCAKIYKMEHHYRKHLQTKHGIEPMKEEVTE